MRSRSLELRDPGTRIPSTEDLSSDSESSNGTVPDEELPLTVAVEAEQPVQESDRSRWRKFFIRSLALLCAMTLSIGSHFGSYFLGPLKSRLSREIGTSNAEFSLMIAAFDLNSTWTPLVGGLMVCRLGTARSSIIATSAILLGQIILMLGDFMESVLCMAIGLFIFGLGISPLAVVQETIVVRFFASHGLGISLAIGLIAGKGASFVSARISYPLSQHFGPHAPFVVSTLLALFSFGVNLIYVSASAWLARGAGVQLEPGDEKDRLGARMSAEEAVNRVGEKRLVRLKDMQRFGDVFWLYLGINILCGAIWSPFTHLASNIIEQRYSLSEAEASKQASLLLAGSLVLYPICGLLTDRLKHGSVVFILFSISAFLTLLCYSWLILPPAITKTPYPAMLAFSGGHGFSTLLLVILVPHILPLSHVSTGLGAHKSIEKAGSTISQTLAGLILDLKGKKHTTESNKPGFDSTAPSPNSLRSIQILLFVFFIINVIQFGGTLILWRDGTHLQKHPRHSPSVSTVTSYHPVATEDHERTASSTTHPHRASIPSGSAVLSGSDDEGPSNRSSDGGRLAGRLRNDGSWLHRSKPLLLDPNTPRTNYQSSLASPVRNRNHPSLARSSAQRRRGKLFMILFLATIVSTWILFMSTAIIKLNAKP